MSFEDLRVDYSGFVEAIRVNDNKLISYYIKELFPRLVDYLRMKVQASDDEAIEAVNESVAYVVEQVKKDKIKEDGAILKYLFLTCRHTYLRHQRKYNRFIFYGDLKEMQGAHSLHIEPSQLESMLDKEKEEILEASIKRLSPRDRSIIELLMENPDMGLREAAKIIGITEVNMRVSKRRAIKRLKKEVNEIWKS